MVIPLSRLRHKAEGLHFRWSCMNLNKTLLSALAASRRLDWTLHRLAVADDDDSELE